MISKYIKLTALILGGLLFLYSAFVWYGFIKDTEYESELVTCRETSGSIEERKDCAKFPEKKHLAKRSNAFFWTIITFSTPGFLLGSQWLYLYFFIKKKRKVDID